MKKMLLSAAALLMAGLGQTSCQAPAAPAPKAEPIDAVRPPSASKPAPAKPASPAAVAPHQVAARPAGAGIIYGPSRLFIEKPHRRKVKYGRHRWVIV